jgi:hypothetical protein
MIRTPGWVVVGIVAAIGWAAGASAGEVRLADKGQANCVVVAPANWAADAIVPEGLPPQAGSLLKARQAVLRDSIKDLALYLGKMSGTTVEIVEAMPAGDKRVPVFIGTEAQKVFGPVGISKAGLFGFRVVADPGRGLGLYGESDYGTSYAVYELLHRLGCRWFMPSDLGEVVPERPTLAVPAMDEKIAPATQSRGMWHGGADFLRRNRLARESSDIVWLVIGDGSLERMFKKEDLEAHPEWRALGADGNPHHVALRLTHPGVADYLATKILAALDKVYEPMQKAGLRPGYALTPFDGQVPTEDPTERPHDPEPRIWEPAAGRWSVTDRCMLLHNRIADKVRAKYPKVAFGDLAYVNKMYPPAKQPVPKDFHITIAPIDFNRYHPMDWPDHPNEYWVRDLVQGWGKKGANLSAYWYGANLAELSAPCPFITKWGTDVRILVENNLQNWQPETMNGWDSMMPGYVLASRIAFYPQEKPEAILQDLWTKFYGAAAEPMARYWTGIDRAYLEAREYAGSPYGYLKIFTPEVMKEARADLDAALAASRTPLEYRRVKLIEESFALFELSMQMRTDWADAKLATLAEDYESWRWGIRHMQREYRVPMNTNGRYTTNAYTGDGYVQGRHGNPAWSDGMYAVGFKDGSRMDKEFARLGKPMLEWKWRHNPGPEADSLPWTKPEHDDEEWKTTHVVRDTWSSLGHHFSLTDEASGRSGRMAYRTSQKLPAVPAGRKAFLWIGSTDGSAKLFVNGMHVPYVEPDDIGRGKAGETKDAFDGYCKPAQFDVTAALKTGDNQITILCDRYHLNELGTGGLLGPVLLYREK